MEGAAEPLPGTFIEVPGHADALRFLWWSGRLDNHPDEHAMLVHIFGAAFLFYFFFVYFATQTIEL